MMAGRCQGGGRRVGRVPSSFRAAPRTPGIPGAPLNEDGRTEGGHALNSPPSTVSHASTKRPVYQERAGCGQIGTSTWMDRADDRKVPCECRHAPRPMRPCPGGCQPDGHLSVEGRTPFPPQGQLMDRAGERLRPGTGSHRGLQRGPVRRWTLRGLVLLDGV
jgi:hypothetical protein